MARRAADLTQLDLAIAIRPYLADLGVKTSPRSVSGWEAETWPPSANEFSAALHVLGVPVEKVTREESRFFGGAA